MEKKKKNLAYLTCVRSAAAAATKLHQSCPTLGDRIDCSLPGSPVPGIFQARTLEWVAISFSIATINLFSKSVRLYLFCK